MVIIAYDIEIEPDYIAWQVLMNEISSMWRFTWKWLSCLGDFLLAQIMAFNIVYPRHTRMVCGVFYRVICAQVCHLLWEVVSLDYSRWKGRSRDN